MSGIPANRFFQQVYNANSASSAGAAPTTRNNQNANYQVGDGVNKPGAARSSDSKSDPIRQLLGEIRGY